MRRRLLGALFLAGLAGCAGPGSGESLSIARLVEIFFFVAVIVGGVLAAKELLQRNEKD